MKKIVYFDMDGVLADFDGAVYTPVKDPPEMFVPGFFRNLKVMPGAHAAISKLLIMDYLELYIASKPTTGNFSSTIEKYEWIACNFPRLLKKINLVCNKGLLLGDYLIDDDAERWEHKFKGQFIHFDRANPIASWAKVVEIFDVLKYSN